MSDAARTLTVVHGSLAVGGIEQLLVRLGEVLRSRGWRLQFVLQSRTATSLDRRAAALGPVHLLPSDYRDAWWRLGRLRLLPSDVVFAPTSDAYLVAHLLRQRALPRARIVAGVYYPLEYGNPRAHAVYEIGRAAQLLAAAPAQNVVFMNEACRRSTERGLGRSFADSPIVPVPLVVPEAARPAGRPSGARLVSVGRLVDFKGYPFGALEALDQLAREGRSFSYDVYGDGPLRDELAAAVATRGLDGVVQLKGEVPPERFGAVCEGALAFLGMGTAAVEAAAMGVPTLLAAVGERRPLVHGWFSQVEGFGVGEVQEGDVLRPVAELLREVDSADDTAYDALAQADRDRALQFDLAVVADAFETVLETALPDDRRLHVTDLLRGWADRVRDSRRLRGAAPSRRSVRYQA